MGKIYGYCRISKTTQNIDRQVQNILKFEPSAEIIKEAYTGTKVLGRKEFERLLKIVSPDDTIIFDSVSRMSRDKEEGVKNYFELQEKGVNLIFLKERYIDTAIYKDSISQSIENTGDEIADCYIEATNKVLRILAKRQIEKAFEQSEKEVKDIQQRTAEGIGVARKKGKQIGRKFGDIIEPKKKQPIIKIIKAKSKSFFGTNSDSEVIAIINNTRYTDKNGIEKTYYISRNTYYKYKKEISLIE